MTVIYLVTNKEWSGALVSCFRQPGREWEYFGGDGHVSRQLADEMVSHGIAQYDEPNTPDQRPSDRLSQKDDK